MRFFLHLAIFLLIPLIYSCTTLPKDRVARQDPLIGKIVHTPDHKFIPFKTLVDQIADQDVIYLSEKHDNPMHHTIQHQIIKALIEKGKAPLIGFEFFSMEDTPFLLSFVDSGTTAHTPKMEAAIEKQARKKLGWDTQSDTMWGYYYGLMKLARQNHLSIAGIDLSSSQKRRITRKGLEGLSAVEKKTLFSSRFSNIPYEIHMKSIFKSVHCGMNHEKMTSRLYDTWVARNDKMALSISQLYEKDAKGPVVVIIGRGHTEYGLGVMDRVRALNPDISQVDIGLTEITRAPSDFADYLRPLELEGFEPTAPSDYLWFTQRVSYADPCEEFKASLKKMKQKE
ncbi:MAG: ChaN family lipoprotein [Proteobacteria bacterium]|nr:ChaN family lipoprotein [Pseudomonadota bacterium]